MTRERSVFIRGFRFMLLERKEGIGGRMILDRVGGSGLLLLPCYLERGTCYFASATCWLATKWASLLKKCVPCWAAAFSSIVA